MSYSVSVSQRGRGWRVRIKHNGERYEVGGRSTLEGARRLADEARANPAAFVERAKAERERQPARPSQVRTRTTEERVAWESTRYVDDIETQLFVNAFPGGATLEEIGEFLGVTRERVRQMEADALRSLAMRLRLAGVTESGEQSAITWVDEGRWWG